MDIWQAGIQSHLLKYLRNPEDTHSVQEIYRCYTQDEKSQKAMTEVLRADQKFCELYKEWYQPEEYFLAQLKALPSTSFGYAYADFMERNELKLDFISEFGAKDILSYLWSRARHVHDITHMLLGFDTSIIGEAGVKGFELAQFQSPGGTAILGGALIALSASQPELITPLMDAVLRGYTLGQRYPFVYGIKWDLEWETPLDKLRAKYRLPLGGDAST